jgi:hypothetical protein
MATKKNSFFSTLIPVLFLFIVINVLAELGKRVFPGYNINYSVVLAANLLLFVAGIFSLWMNYRAAKSKNPNAFVQSVMMATTFKLLLFGMAMILYLLQVGKSRNVPGVIIGMILYIVYTAIEIRIALQLNKNKNAGN